MADLIFTLDQDEELWSPTTEQEIINNWEPWETKRVPSSFSVTERDLVWICHRGFIVAFNSIREIEYEWVGMQKTKLLIQPKVYHILENPIEHNCKGRSWEKGTYLRKYLTAEEREKYGIKVKE